MSNLAITAFKDGLISFLFMFVSSSIGAVHTVLAPIYAENETLKLIILLGLISMLLMTFGNLSEALGGASFNPTGNLANYFVGEFGETLTGLVVRIPAQLVGSICGTWAISQIMPSDFVHTLNGPKLSTGIDVRTGFQAEAVSTFLVTIVLLWVILSGSSNSFLKTPILLGTVLSNIMVGSSFTGPAMNPSVAFAWAYLDNSHSTWEHFLVYWLGPIVGSIIAALVFNLFLKPKPEAKAKAE